MLLSLVIMSLPSVISDDAPHFKRLPGIIPVVFVPVALALEAVGNQVSRWVGRVAGFAAVGLVILASAASTTHDYFGVYPGQPRVAGAFYVDTLEKGEMLRQLAGEKPTFAPPLLMKQAIVSFSTIGRPIRTFDVRAGLLLPPDGPALYALDPVDVDAIATFDARWRGPMVRRDLVSRRGVPLLTVFGLPAVAQITPGVPHSPRFGEAIVLEGYSVSWSDDDSRHVALVLHWRAAGEMSTNYTVFVHLLDTTGHGVGQHDKPLLGGSYPTQQWRLGDRIIDRHDLLVAADATPPLTFEIGWYEPGSGARLPGADSDGAPIPDAALRVPAGWPDR